MRDDKDVKTADTARSEGPRDGGGERSREHKRAREFTDYAPKLSLPKAGGAIRSIGEKFSVNAATGASGLTVPIFMTALKQAPELALSYNSGSGNGPFGVGWSLSPPSISRKTDRGLPLYEASDIFILSGAEDLQRELKFAAASDGSGPNVWKKEEYSDGDYRVLRYAPRSLSDLSRIEQRIHKRDPTDRWWLTVSKDNVRHYFGRYPQSDFPDDNAKVFDPASPQRIFSWMLAEIAHPNGARTLFEYKEESNDNVDEIPAEDLRRHNLQAQRYLKRVYYGNSPSAAQDVDWSCQLVFDYGEHEADAAAKIDEAKAWKCREDAFSEYRSRFEVRTRRLCRRVLCFNRFEQIGSQPVLTRSTDFSYEEAPEGARLVRVEHKGYKPNESGSLDTDVAPALTFEYAAAKPDEPVRFVDPPSRRHAPQGAGGPYSFVDIDGEGLVGVLSEQADAWRFKRNEGEAKFGEQRVIAWRPQWASLSAGGRIATLESDGQPYLVAYGAPLSGYSARLDNGDWAPFQPFDQNPQIDFAAPDIRHIDLDGDGKADIAILRDEEIVWRKNEGRRGYSAERRSAEGDDERRGPRRLFASNLESIFTADMTGDGLDDIVRIRNGNIAYWPNLGYGRFGEKVVMGDAPIFDHEERFSPSRIRLGDIDGLGPTDILYLGRDGASYWINQSGNRFGARIDVQSFPKDDGYSDATLVDFLGKGTSCLVWSSPLPAEAEAPWRYIDLMGDKPNLLSRVNNGAGAETRFSYKASTYYYLRDRKAGTPWVTKLPFPVQVVDRVETHDLITGNVHVRKFAYHHGYYDRPEREFRGFGRVDEWVTEGKGSDGAEIFERPPILTRTWHHTGAWGDQRRLSTQYQSEYYATHAEYNLPDSVLEFSDVEAGSGEPYSPKELREARRALRGQILRQEIYQCDADSEYPTPHPDPYVVTENRYAVRRLQPAREGNEHAVFGTVSLETLARHYEEAPDDPRLLHDLTLAANDYGQVTRNAQIAYPRLQATTSDPGAQTAARIKISETDFINTDTGDVNFTPSAWRRVGAPKSAFAWELKPPSLSAALYDIAYLNAAFAAADAVDPANLFEYSASSAAGKRMLSARIQVYRPDSAAGVLDFTPLDYGAIEPLALPGRDWSLIFTDQLLETAGLRDPAGDTASRMTTADLVDAGYVSRNDLAAAPELVGLTALTAAFAKLGVAESGAWFVSDGVAAYDSTRFYVVKEARDPWGNVSLIEHDALGVLPTRVTDAVSSVVEVVNDYRVLAPQKVIDPNGAVQEAEFDALGRVVKIARSGFDETGAVGDTLASPTQILEYHDEEAGDPVAPQPNYVHAWSRHTHFSDLDAADRAKSVLEQGVWSEARLYSDGFGRELETKQKVRSGDAWVAATDANTGEQVPVSIVAASRWVGTGRTLYDNRGDPVRQYEPYFSTTADYEEEDVLRLWGVSPTIHYDPLGRAVRTDFPDGSYSKVEFSPWHEKTWDQNDTVRLSAGTSSVDSDWFTARGAPDPTLLPPPPTHLNAYAAWVAAAHADTPLEKRLDVLGRPVLAIERNAWVTDDPINPNSNPKVLNTPAPYESESLLDIAGNALEIRDANNNCALKTVFDLAGRPLNTRSNDAGERWLLPAADGQPAVVINERGFRIEQKFDELRRPTENWVSDALGAARLAVKTIYGEAATAPEASHLRGKPWKIHDQAGVVVNHVFDFKGNLKKTGRVLLAAPAEPDWSASPGLDTVEHFIEYRVDAENRNIWESAPDGSELTFAYDVSGRFVASAVKHPSQLAAQAIVSDILYDAKGQRTQIDYGNGATTTYAYDAQTFRLAKLETTAPGGKVQDIAYAYDAAGNIVEIVDTAQETVFTNNQAITPRRRFRYDALYRLIRAEGREHRALAMSPDQHFAPGAEPLLVDEAMLQTYVQTYDYDEVGNIRRMRHAPSITAGWTRDYAHDYDASPGDSNRLASTGAPNDPNPVLYAHDAHGNILGLPHLGADGLTWDYADRLIAASLPGGQRELYAYDASGERVVKRTEKGAVVEERVYLGPMFEIWRSFTNGDRTDERATLHVIDGESRVAMMETATLVNSAPAPLAPVFRFQIGDHLGSAALELTVSGEVLTYEEFHPYGTTAIFSESGALGPAFSRKRYRYTGKERDEATGLNYHSARYYIPWLGRWLSADPKGLMDGMSLYSYVSGQPIRTNDPRGTYGEAGHFYTVLLVSLAAGFDAKTSFQNAFFAQMPDEVSQFDAVERAARVAFSPNKALLANDKKRGEQVGVGLHSLSGELGYYEQGFRDDLVSSYDPGTMQFGFALHSFGDAYSHTQINNPFFEYPPGTGHGPDGSKPDDIFQRPTLYNQYVSDLYSTLTKAAAKQGIKPRLSLEQVMELSVYVSTDQKGLTDIQKLRSLTLHMMGNSGVKVDDPMMQYRPENEGGLMRLPALREFLEDKSKMFDFLKDIPENEYYETIIYFHDAHGTYFEGIR